MSTSAPIACSMCYGSGYNMAGQPCSCGSLRTRILSKRSEIVQLRAENAELTAQLAAAEKLLIECRSSVRLDWQNYERLLMNNNLTGSREAITDEAKRLHELLLAIDAAIAAQKGEKL